MRHPLVLAGGKEHVSAENEDNTDRKPFYRRRKHGPDTVHDKHKDRGCEGDGGTDPGTDGGGL